MSFETFEKLSIDKKELILSTGIRAFSEKCYKEVSTEYITQKCEISKGILFHYFGSKKAYYFYCLEKSMERLMARTEEIEGNDFYELLFANMERKISICMQYKDEMHMVNMASRDASAEIAQQKEEIIRKYLHMGHLESEEFLRKVLMTLEFRENYNRRKLVEGLHMYIHAVLNKYLLQYQQMPDQFFENSENIKAEMKEYLDMMLYGICKY